jgi:hypothetical protein
MALAGDNWMGTWKLNTGKSKFSPGPGPRSQTLKFEPSEGGIKMTSTLVNSEGKETQGGYSSKWDGKDVSITGNANADTVAPKRIDANSYSNTWKKDGKVTLDINATVSPDGKVMTIVQTGRNAKGEPVDSTLVFEKQ